MVKYKRTVYNFPFGVYGFTGVIIDVPVFKGFAITEFDPLAFFLSKSKRS
jgi:hypothetical protein